VLAAATAGQMSFSAFILALPALAPALQDEYGASLSEVGAFLAVVTGGLIATLLPWGVAVDRIGERVSMSIGLFGVSVLLAAAGLAPSLLSLTIVLTTAAALGGCVNSGIGRAVMAWFPSGERGLALAIRQGSMMFAAALGALILPRVAALAGLQYAFSLLAIGCLIGAALAAVSLRSPRTRSGGVQRERATLRDRTLWRLSLGSALICVAQAAVMGFVVLFLHDGREVSVAAAGAALALSQVLGGALRIVSGVWSDRIGSRVVPLRRIALTTSIMLSIAAILTDAALPIVYVVFVVAGGLSLSWNAVSFTAAAELGGYRRSGATLGLQQTVVGVAAILTPASFALLVEATSWRTGWAVVAVFPFAGWLVIRTLPVSQAYAERLGRGPSPTRSP
jgi:MFS family permease